MTFSRLHSLLTAAIIVAALAIVGCSSPKNEYITVEGVTLGTFVMVKCNTTLPETEIESRIMAIDGEMKASMSIFDETSLLSRINRNECDTLDNHLIYNIELAERFYTISDGAYDITVKPLTDVWGFGREESLEMPNIDSILQFVGYDRIAIEGNRLIKQDSRTQIDLNSIAKGYTVDVVSQELEAMGIVDYIVNIGGEIRCRGRNAEGKLWSVGIETPYDGNIAIKIAKDIRGLLRSLCQQNFFVHFPSSRFSLEKEKHGKRNPAFL